MTTPRFHTERDPGRPTRGGRVRKVAASMGKSLMPWQARAADVTHEVEPDGSWAYSIVVKTVPRQAGKTTLFGPVAHTRAATVPAAKCWWTAQTRQDARDSWLDMKDQILASPLGRMAHVREANGSEHVKYPGGGAFRPFAPTPQALHGKANELVGVDEAWAFDGQAGADLDQAILPTFTTTNGQLWIISTAGTAASTWLLDYVQRGRAAVLAGRQDTVCHIEYGVDDEAAEVIAANLTRYKENPGDPAAAQLRDEALRLVLDAHPAAGHTLKMKALHQALEKMTPGDFLRAYGNYWTAAADQVIPEHEWQGRRVPLDAWTAPELGSTVLGIAVSPDGRDGAIVAAWRPRIGAPIRVDVIDARPGTSWMVDRVDELRNRWRITSPVWADSAGPVLTVVDALRRRGIEVATTVLRDYATACSAFLGAVLVGDLEHAGRPDLDKAVRNAARRNVGDGAWAWSRLNSSASIAALEAATIARWGVDHAPEPAAAPIVVSAGRRRRRRQSADLVGAEA